MKTKVCCESFKEFILLFQWFLLDSDCVMAFQQIGAEKLRINYCPSCGTYVRDFTIPQSELKELRENTGII